jgi:hypothetical protein
MKRARVGCFSLAVLCFALVAIETCRDKGEMSIAGEAIETNGLVSVKLRIKNRDWRVTLGNLSVQLDVGHEWDLMSVELPRKTEVETDVYGPKSEWKSVTIRIRDPEMLEAKHEMECVILLSRKPGSSTNVIDGNVSYVGAVIWEKVGPGQQNAEYFKIPVTQR